MAEPTTISEPTLPGEVDVLIVGAGPTGLTLAIELARRDVSFLLIDRDAAPAISSRAIGTQSRTVEVFRLMGIPETELTPSVRPRALRFAEGSRTLARVPFNDRPGGPMLISMDESDTERMLEQRLAQLGGHVSRGVELLRFRVDGDRVISTLRGPYGEEEVRSRYLAGADGAHSTVRQGAGIGFMGSAYPERFLLADLDLDWDLPHDEGHVWIGNDGLVAAVPLPGERRFRLVVPLAPAEAGIEYASETAIADRAEVLLRQRTGLRPRRIGDPIWASAFRISRRQAERYRNGPVFLAGDAAHVHSPVGGQGMNTGIQDAFNLGWKLALAVKGEAAPGLLDTYQEERHPVAQGVLQGTHLGTRLALARNPLLEAVREYVVPAIVNVAPVRRRLVETIAQLRVAYRGSFLSVDADDAGNHRGRWRRKPAGLRAGDRVPDAALLTVPGGEPTALYDLLSDGWLLLLLPGEIPDAARLEALGARARETATIVGGAVRPFLVLNGPREIPDGVPALLDAAGEVSRIFGARDGLVALIRPDGYLGYRGLPEQAGELASYLARVFALEMPAARRDPRSPVAP